jgi:uncharacterized membrane protein YedE/YeeE
MNFVLLSGLIVGIIFGFAMQRGRFCMNSAIRDTVLLKDTTLLKAVGVAILVQMVGFAIMAMAGIISISPKPLFWGANLVGSFIFGIGMVLAGGCASGITYRVGEGMGGAISAVIGLATAGTLTAMGFLKPIKDSLQTSTTITTADGAAPTLANILGLPHYIVAFAVAVIVVVIWVAVAARSKEEAEPKSTASLGERIFKKGWGWLSTGIVIGLIGMLAFYASTLAERSYPLGITAGWITWVKVGLPGVDASVNWIAFLVLGIMLGALLAAWIAGELKFRMPSWGTIGQTFAGGLLMGFGAVCSAGCNVTHILSGLPQLAIGSLVATIAIALGAWLTAYLIFVRPQTA